MPCYSPLRGWQSPEGGRVYFTPSNIQTVALDLPCGKCVGCYLERSKQWAIRAMHETQLHEQNCCLMLSYNDEHNPITLVHKDFQDFAKRLRAKLGKFSYLMCGEYGERYKRPHYHALIFGLDFADKFPFKKSASGNQLYTSDTLDKVWGLGHANISDVTFEMCAYVARYMMAKPTTEAEREKVYNRVDAETGEYFMVTPEYMRMSRRPAIGKDWIQKYRGDVYPHDFVVMNGKKLKPPRFYDKQLEEQDTEKYKYIKTSRKTKANENMDDNTAARLRVKEEVAKAALQLKAREYE